MKPELWKLARALTIGLSTMAWFAITVAYHQERLLYITVENARPPAFSVSGQARPVSFEIVELPKTKPLRKTDPFSFKGKTIWKISAPTRMTTASWPVVTYGSVPNGFLQTALNQGSAPKLTQDKLYVAQFIDGTESASLFFEVRKGKLINVTDKVFGP